MTGVRRESLTSFPQAFNDALHRVEHAGVLGDLIL